MKRPGPVRTTAPEAVPAGQIPAALRAAGGAGNPREAPAGAAALRAAVPEADPHGRIPEAGHPEAAREEVPHGQIPAADPQEALPGSRFPIRVLMWMTGMIRMKAGRMIGDGGNDRDQEGALQLRPFL